jgi:hypothetical protein
VLFVNVSLGGTLTPFAADDHCRLGILISVSTAGLGPALGLNVLYFPFSEATPSFGC